MKLHYHKDGEQITDRRIDEIAESVRKWLTEARDRGQHITIEVEAGSLAYARKGWVCHASSNSHRFAIEIGPDESAVERVPADHDGIIGFVGPGGDIDVLLDRFYYDNDCHASPTEDGGPVQSFEP